MVYVSQDVYFLKIKVYDNQVLQVYCNEISQTDLTSTTGYFFQSCFKFRSVFSLLAGSSKVRFHRLQPACKEKRIVKSL